MADAARLKRAASAWFGLLALPGLRAPLVEFVGQPRVSELAAPADALPGVTRKKLVFTASGAGKPAVPPLSFAWLIDEQDGVAAAGKNADAALKAIVQSAHGQHPTLAAQPDLSDAVERASDRVALFAYLDARLAFGVAGASSPEPARLLLSLGKRGTSAVLRLEIAKPALDLALRGGDGAMT